MSVKYLSVVAACVGSAFAFALDARATNPILARAFPSACEPICGVVNAIANIDQADPSTITPLCTGGKGAELVQCFSCLKANAPEVMTPAVVARAQVDADKFVEICRTIGLPIPSITLPVPGLPASTSATEGPSSSSMSSIPPTTTSDTTITTTSSESESTSTTPRPTTSTNTSITVRLGPSTSTVTRSPGSLTTTETSSATTSRDTTRGMGLMILVTTIGAAFVF